MHDDVSSADDARPRNFRVRPLKGVIQFSGRFADDCDVSADSVHDQRLGSPVVATGNRILGYTPAGVADVPNVDEWILGRHGGLQRYGLGKDAVSYVGVDTAGFDQIHVNAQQMLEIREEAAHIEQPAAFLQVHKEIDIATGLGFAQSDRAEYANIPAAMQFGKAQYLGSLMHSQCIQRHRYDLRLYCPSYSTATRASPVFSSEIWAGWFQPALDNRPLTFEEFEHRVQPVDLRLGDAGAARADQDGGRGGGADHPADGAGGPERGDTAGEGAGGRPAGRDPQADGEQPARAGDHVRPHTDSTRPAAR